MKNRRGFVNVLTVIVVFAVIGIAVYGVMLYYRNPPAPESAIDLSMNQPIADSTETDISSWSTYRSNPGGWEVKLPPDFHVYESPPPVQETDGAFRIDFQGVVFSVDTFEERSVREYRDGGFSFATIEIKPAAEKPATVTMLRYVQDLQENSLQYNEYLQSTRGDFNSVEEVTLRDGRRVVWSDHAVFEGCPTGSYWFERNESEYVRIIVSGYARARFCPNSVLSDAEMSRMTEQVSDAISTFLFVSK